MRLAVDLCLHLSADQVVQRGDLVLRRCGLREIHAPPCDRFSRGAADGLSNATRQSIQFLCVLGVTIRRGACRVLRWLTFVIRRHRPEQTIGHHELGVFFAQCLVGFDFIVQVGQRIVVHVKPFEPVRPEIGFATMHGEVGVPAQKQHAVGIVPRWTRFAVILTRVEQTVAIRVLAVKQFWSDACNQQQFVQRIQRAIGGLIRRHHTEVVFTLDTIFTRVVIFV